MSKDVIYGGTIVVLLALLVLSVFTAGFGVVQAPSQCPDVTEPTTPPSDSGAEPAQPAQPAQPSAPAALQRITVTTGVLPLLGQESASVAWVEFSDYQCPFCERLYTGAEAQVKTNYIDTGKVKLYFRDFPLSFHPQALPAAMAAACANEQGKFWDMHGKLFTGQQTWSGASDADSIFAGYATDLGLNDTAFLKCYNESTYLEDITNDFSDGQSYGVQGTPSNFLIIPKSKMTEATANSVVDSLNDTYGEGIILFENDNEYTFFIPGAYPYEAFDAVLSKVSY
jgi:protein-disulfide isomerase